MYEDPAVTASQGEDARQIREALLQDIIAKGELAKLGRVAFIFARRSSFAGTLGFRDAVPPWTPPASQQDALPSPALQPPTLHQLCERRLIIDVFCRGQQGDEQDEDEEELVPQPPADAVDAANVLRLLAIFTSTNASLEGELDLGESLAAAASVARANAATRLSGASLSSRLLLATCSYVRQFRHALERLVGVTAAPRAPIKPAPSEGAAAGASADAAASEDA